MAFLPMAFLVSGHNRENQNRESQNRESQNRENQNRENAECSQLGLVFDPEHNENIFDNLDQPRIFPCTVFLMPSTAPFRGRSILHWCNARVTLYVVAGLYVRQPGP